MYRLFYLLEMPLERALRMSAMTCGELAGYEKQESRKSVSRCGAFFFPRWGRRVFDFSALSFADMEKRESFLAVMERASRPFFAEEKTQRRFRTTAPSMAGPAAIRAALRFYREETERMYRSFGGFQGRRKYPWAARRLWRRSNTGSRCSTARKRKMLSPIFPRMSSIAEGRRPDRLVVCVYERGRQ